MISLPIHILHHIWEIFLTNWACSVLLKPWINAMSMESVSTQKELDLFLILKVFYADSTSLELLIQILTLLLIILNNSKALQGFFIQAMLSAILNQLQEILKRGSLPSKASWKEHWKRVKGIHSSQLLAATTSLEDWNLSNWGDPFTIRACSHSSYSNSRSAPTTLLLLLLLHIALGLGLHHIWAAELHSSIVRASHIKTVWETAQKRIVSEETERIESSTLNLLALPLIIDNESWALWHSLWAKHIWLWLALLLVLRLVLRIIAK